MTWRDQMRQQWHIFAETEITADRSVVIVQTGADDKATYTSAIITSESCAQGVLIDEAPCPEYSIFQEIAHRELIAANRIPTPRWFYARPVLRTMTELYPLTDRGAVDGICEVEDEEQTRIVLCCFYEKEDPLQKYYNELYGIQFDGEYVAIFYWRGKYGDSSSLHITDAAGFSAMADYMRTLIPEDEYEREVHDLDAPLSLGFIKDLDEI